MNSVQQKCIIKITIFKRCCRSFLAEDWFVREILALTTFHGIWRKKKKGKVGKVPAYWLVFGCYLCLLEPGVRISLRYVLWMSTGEAEHCFWTPCRPARWENGYKTWVGEPKKYQPSPTSRISSTISTIASYPLQIFLSVAVSWQRFLLRWNMKHVGWKEKANSKTDAVHN